MRNIFLTGITVTLFTVLNFSAAHADSIFKPVKGTLPDLIFQASIESNYPLGLFFSISGHIIAVNPTNGELYDALTDKVIGKLAGCRNRSYKRKSTGDQWQ